MYFIHDPLGVQHIVFFESKSDRKKNLVKVTEKARTLITTKREFIGGFVNEA